MKPFGIMNLLFLMEKFRPNLFLHSANVANLVSRIYTFLHLTEIDLETMILGALLHDAGKIFLKRDIIDKPAPLTEYEWKEMKKHPCLGAFLIAEKGGSESLIEMIRYHHERWDGKGYKGLPGEKIPLSARIIALADALDAMTSARSYRLPLELCIAFEEIHQGSGTQFDPQLVASLQQQPSWQTVTYRDPAKFARQIIREKQWLKQLTDLPGALYHPLIRYGQYQWLDRLQSTFMQMECSDIYHG